MTGKYDDLSDPEAVMAISAIMRTRREYRAAHKAAVEAPVLSEAAKLRLSRAEDEYAGAWWWLTERIGQPFVKETSE